MSHETLNFNQPVLHAVKLNWTFYSVINSQLMQVLVW